MHIQRTWKTLTAPIVVGIFLLACIITFETNTGMSDLDIEDLLLDVSAFPEGWSMSPEGPMQPGQAPLGGMRSSARRSLVFYAPNNVAVQKVDYYQNAREAQQEFDRQIPIWFPVSEFWSTWEKPEEISFQSEIANRYQVACAENSGNLYCGMLGQYQAILIRFSANINRALTYDEFEGLLREIDRRVSEYYLMPR